jgi:hypothetical protein
VKFWKKNRNIRNENYNKSNQNSLEHITNSAPCRRKNILTENKVEGEIKAIMITIFKTTET